MNEDLPEILTFKECVNHTAKLMNLSLKDAENFILKSIKEGKLKGHVLINNNLKRVSIDEKDNINILNS